MSERKKQKQSNSSDGIFNKNTRAVLNTKLRGNEQIKPIKISDKKHTSLELADKKHDIRKSIANTHADNDMNTKIEVSSATKGATKDTTETQIIDVNETTENKIDYFITTRNINNTTRYGLVTEDILKINLAPWYFKIKDKNGLPSKIRLTKSINDGGSNTNTSNKRMSNEKWVETTITDYKNTTEKKERILGERGCLTYVVYMPNGKMIIVPRHARQKWREMTTWVKLNDNIDVCVMQPKNKLGSVLQTAQIVAVCSDDTNGIETFTEMGVKLLNIKQYELSGIEYTLEYKIEKGVCITRTQKTINAFNTIKIKTNNCTCTVCNAIMKNDKYDICKECEIYCGSVNTFASKFQDRHDENPIKVLQALFGGISLQMLHDIYTKGTLQGFEDLKITEEHWKKAALLDDTPYLVTTFTKKRAPPQAVREAFGNNTIKPGQILVVDFIFWHHMGAGTQKTNFTSRDGFKGGLLAIDFVTCLPVFYPMKNESKETYVKTIQKIIKNRKAEISEGENAQKWTHILWDQDKTQLSSAVEMALDLNDLIPIRGKIDSNDLAVLNVVSAIIHRMAHYFLRWSNMSMGWICYAYRHAVLVFRYRPSGGKDRTRGRGFSPYSQWYGVPTHTGHFPVPWGCASIVHSRAKPKTGGIDVVFVGYDIISQEGMYWSPLQTTVLRRNWALHVVIQPPYNRLDSIVLGRSIFDKGTIMSAPKFATHKKKGRVWVQDTDRTKKYDGYFFSFEQHPYREGVNSNGQSFMCSCRETFVSLSTLRKHWTISINKDNENKNVALYEPHCPFKKPPKRWKNRIEKTKRLIVARGIYDSKIMEQIENKIGIKNVFGIHGIGQMKRLVDTSDDNEEKLESEELIETKTFDDEVYESDNEEKIEKEVLIETKTFENIDEIEWIKIVTYNHNYYGENQKMGMKY